jgi:hypothetical protein
MNKSFLITEQERKRIIGMHTYATRTQHLNEIYEGGIIQEGDDLCEIICKRKMAAYGSNGDAVKEIQHALAKCGYNAKYEGGGMNTGCAKDKNSCDGKFRQHTRDAVKEFQKDNKLTVDGKVGYNTLMSLQEEGCIDLPDCKCDDDNNQKQDNDLKFDDPKKMIDDVNCDTLKKCVYDHIIMVPVPDYNKFNKCIGGGQKDDTDLKDNIYLDKEGFVEGCTWHIRTNDTTQGYKRIIECPKSLNCMPGPNKDMKYCNSKAIKACEAKKCTNITY